MAICLDDGVICTPNHSKSGKSLCLPGELKCNGEDDCQNGFDEENCPTFLPGGLQALIVIVVIAVIILIPVLYVIIRKKRRKAVIPSCMRPAFSRLSPCCSDSKDPDRSSQQLTGNNFGGTQNTVNNDGFTNVGFDTNPSANNSNQQHSVTGQALNKFKKPVSDNEIERVPSFRDWQANRLQQPKNKNNVQDEMVRGAGNGYEHNQRGSYDNKAQHRVEINNSERIQAEAVYNKGPITYAPPVNRSTQDNATVHGNPYTIASPDRRSKYEARSHLYRTQVSGVESISAGSNRGDWEYHVAHNANRYQINSGDKDPPSYDTYQHVSSAVPPQQLRDALERVAGSPSRATYSTANYDGSADTVV